MRKSIILPILGGLLVGLYSCGGGGGGGSTSNTGTNTGTNTTNPKVVSKVEASIVQGAIVCVNGTDICNQTNSSGIVSLTLPPGYSLNTTLSVNVGNVTIGFINATAPYVPITPLSLADNDTQTAQELGALLHALAGDTSGNATVIDLSNVTVNISANETQPLVDLLKKSKDLQIHVKHGDREYIVKINNQTVLCDDKKVNYDIKHIEKEHEKEEVAEEFMHFIFKAWKKHREIVFLNPQGEVVDSCNVVLNPENPLEFKFEKCLNDIYTSTNWLAIDTYNSPQIINIETHEPEFKLIKNIEGKIELQSPQEDQTLFTTIQKHNEGNHSDNATEMHNNENNQGTNNEIE